MGWGWGWRPHVPVAQRLAQAARQMEKLRKKGVKIQPVVIAGREIARTFWGKAWCEHLEQFSDFENRLPRGRTYVRNGSVCHLEVREGKIAAKVSGSSVYDVKLTVRTLPPTKWRSLKERCAGRVGSLLELLQGRLSHRVMEVVTDRERGLFPLPKEISLDCSCPDWAGMCKHVAGALYGVGARLDEKPELLFLLRGVNHEELVGSAQAGSVIARGKKGGKHKKLSDGNLEEVFGVEFAAPSRKARAAKAGRRSKRLPKRLKA